MFPCLYLVLCIADVLLMSSGVCSCYHLLVKNKVCLAQVEKHPCKHCSAASKRSRRVSCLNSSLGGEQHQAFSHTVEKSCHGEISHSSDETNYFIAEINECRNGREWRLGRCFLLKVECNCLSGKEGEMAVTCFYYRVWE